MTTPRPSIPDQIQLCGLQRRFMRQWLAGACLVLVLMGAGPMAVPAVPLLEPTWIEKLQNQSWELVRGGQMDLAIAKVKDAVRTHSFPADLAQLHELLGDLETARQGAVCEDCIREYLQALSFESAKGELLYKAGSAMFGNLATTQKGVVLLERSLELGYTNAQTFYLLGSHWKSKAESTTDRLDQTRFLNRALEQYKMAVSLDTNHVAAIGNLADIYFNLGDYKDASILYRDALRHPMGKLQLLALKSRLADSENHRQNIEEALRLLDEADALYSTNKAPSQVGARLCWHLEGVRVLKYRLEGILAARKNADVERVLKALLARAVTAKQIFEEVGALPDDIDGMLAQARADLLKER